MITHRFGICRGHDTIPLTFNDKYGLFIVWTVDLRSDSIFITAIKWFGVKINLP